MDFLVFKLLLIRRFKNLKTKTAGIKAMALLIESENCL